MSMWKETVTYGMCFNRIDGVKKDYCKHFLAGGEEGTPEALFCAGCGCHVCFHRKVVTKEFDITNAIVKYGVCAKNHAAHLGKSMSYDGCREFLAADKEGALFCAVCGCHRNFHEKNYS